VRQGSLPQTELNYTGQRLDSTGLLFYNARYYDPQVGKFISSDTIVPKVSNPQAFNRYGYAYNNPLKYTDATGHRPLAGDEGDSDTSKEEQSDEEFKKERTDYALDPNDDTKFFTDERKQHVKERGFDEHEDGTRTKFDPDRGDTLDKVTDEAIQDPASEDRENPTSDRDATYSPNTDTTVIHARPFPEDREAWIFDEEGNPHGGGWTSIPGDPYPKKKDDFSSDLTTNLNNTTIFIPKASSSSSRIFSMDIIGGSDTRVFNSSVGIDNTSIYTPPPSVSGIRYSML
jgi:RHS repeat-associated protein